MPSLCPKPYTVLALAGVALLAACRSVEIDLADRPCDADGACARNYDCHPVSRRCVAHVVTDCGRAGALCPQDVRTGDRCALPGSFIPCREGASGCDEGCRTCSDANSWSGCERDGCEIWQTARCASCADNCELSVAHAVATCAVDDGLPACDVVACLGDYENSDGVGGNGCECLFSGAELCDGLDNDCLAQSVDGSDEPGFGSSCDGLDSDLCADGQLVCGIDGMACDDDSFGQLELCDGLDNDCNSATPDGSDAASFGEPCDSDDSDSCNDDVIGCDGTALGCVDTPGVLSELLGAPACSDGLDNDCDGLTDGQDPDCLACRPITISNATAALPAGYTVSVTFNHASLVQQNWSRSDGNDVVVLAQRAGQWVPIDRAIDLASGWNRTTTMLWFKLDNALAADALVTEHLLCFGDLAATAALDNRDAVYLFADGFEDIVASNAKWMALNLSNYWSVTNTQARSGSNALKAAPLAGGTALFVAQGVDEGDVLFESHWYLSSVANLDLSQAVRHSRTPTGFSQYETNFEGTAGWDLAKIIDGNWSELLDQAAGQNPLAGVWTRVATVVVGSNMRVLRDGQQLHPATGWSDVGTELSSGTVGFRVYNIPAADNWWIDDVAVRKYVDPEPTASLGPLQPPP